MSLRVSLLGVDEVGEFGGVPNKEHGRVVEDPVKVTFIGPQLDGETSWITGGIGGARFTANGGEAYGCTDFLTNGCEKRTRRDIAQVMCELEVTMGTGAFGVHLTQGECMRNYLTSGMLTTRSGIRSRSKCARRSMWWKSWEKHGTNQIEARSEASR
jgi:hypothetical protein